jgi:hypothetical protein
VECSAQKWVVRGVGAGSKPDAIDHLVNSNGLALTRDAIARDLWVQGWRRAGRRRCRYPTGSSSAPAAPGQSVDVAPILDKAVAAKKEKLEWRTSIVDLMKALDIDSSLTARKELAKELGYTGDSNDSASMNIWLHKQVMIKLAANGGKLPPEIKH